MLSQDFLFYSLGIGFLVLVGFLSYAAYQLAQSLRTLNLILQNAEDITSDVDMIKNGVKFGFLNILSMFLKKGGEKNGK